jgi:hypothetical protein
LVEIVGISPSNHKLFVRAKSLAAVVAVMAAAPAQAAPPWSPPAVIPASDAPPRVEANDIDQAVLVPRVSAGKFGAAPQLVQWRGTADGRVLAALNGTTTLRVRTSSINVASSRYAVSRILHLDAKIGDRSNLERKQIGWRAGSADLSSFGTEHKIGGPRSIRWTPKLAVNADGSAIAAWHHIVRGRSDEIQVAYRFAGRGFSAIRTIASTGIDDESIVGVGIDNAGRAIIAYSRNRQLAVRVIKTNTGWMSKESRVAPPAGQRGPTEITVGTGDPGQVVVAWRAYPVTEGPTGHVDAAAAIMPVGSNRLRPAVSLGEGNIVAYPRGPIVATVDADGRPVVAWTVPSSPGVSVPMVVQASNSGVFGAPQALDASGSIGSIIRDGEGVAVGYLRETPGGEGHGSPLGVFVARRGVDGLFAPGELVDDAGFTGGTIYDGLNPPGLGELNNGGLTAIYANVGVQSEGEARVSTRP